VLQLEFLDILLEPVELSEELVQKQLPLFLVKYVRGFLEVFQSFGCVQKRQNKVFDRSLLLLQGLEFAGV